MQHGQNQDSSGTRGLPIHAGCIAETIEAKSLFEIVAVAVLPVMVLVYYLIQRLVVHHTRAETVLMLEELVVEAMNKHDHDIED